jgi:hypothetical protein
MSLTTNDWGVAQSREIHAKADFQFDYFMIGGSAAVIAFSTQTFVASQWTWLILIAWFFLMLTMGGSLGHLAMSLQGLEDLTKHAALHQDQINLHGAIGKNEAIFVAFPLDKLVEPEEVEEFMEINLGLQDANLQKMRKSAKKMDDVHFVRILTLVAGLVALSIWKVLVTI